MKKPIHRILSLMLLLALLLGMLPAGGATRAYATETETVDVETEESTEVLAETEETTTETEVPLSTETETAEPEAPAEEDSDPDNADGLPRDPATGYGKPTGTIEELESIPVPDEILER